MLIRIIIVQTIQMSTNLPKTCNEVSKSNDRWKAVLSEILFPIFFKLTSTYLKATSKHFCVRRFLAASQPRLYEASPWPRQGLILGGTQNLFGG